jgi:peptide/nickel transport system permease protein
LVAGEPDESYVTDVLAPGPTVAHASSRPRRTLLWFLVIRVLTGLATLLVVSMLVFAATEVLPGDAASAVLGKSATPDQVAQLRKLMGLDKPAVQRYGEWLGGILTGNLGNSAAGFESGSKVPIWGQINDKLANSLILAAIVTVFMIPFSLALGVVAATRAGRPLDHTITSSSLAIVSLPEFVIGSLLIIAFFTWLNLLPPVSLLAPGESPLGHPRLLVLPALTLLGATLAGSTRMVRAGMIETMRSDFVRMAELNGLPRRRVVSRYALRNALAPAIQVFGQNIQYLVGGIIVVEYLFSYPGLGKELVDAVAIRDVREVQTIAILIAAFCIFVNIVTDFLVVLLVPKLRTGNA